MQILHKDRVSLFNLFKLYCSPIECSLGDFSTKDLEIYKIKEYAHIRMKEKEEGAFGNISMSFITLSRQE